MSLLTLKVCASVAAGGELVASSLYQVVRGVFADCARMCSARAEAARDSRTDVGRDLALDGAEGSNIVFTLSFRGLALPRHQDAAADALGISYGSRQNSSASLNSQMNQ